MNNTEKRIITFLSAISLAAGTSVPSFANSDPRDPYGDNAGADEMVLACRDFADNDIGIKRVRGLCNAFYRAEDPVGFCISVRDMGALEEFGWESQGDCIAALTSP